MLILSTFPVRGKNHKALRLYFYRQRILILLQP